MSTFRYGTHLPVLIKVVEKTSGPILEVGAGAYSTPFLHYACYKNKRPLTTLESDDKYCGHYQKLKNDYHKVKKVKDWGTFNFGSGWEVAFVDNAPAETRGPIIEKLKDTDYIIAHDTIVNDKAYGYEILDSFKYRLDFFAGKYSTSIVSNKHSLEGILD